MFWSSPVPSALPTTGATSTELCCCMPNDMLGNTLSHCPRALIIPGSTATCRQARWQRRCGPRRLGANPATFGDKGRRQRTLSQGRLPRLLRGHRWATKSASSQIRPDQHRKESGFGPGMPHLLPATSRRPGLATVMRKRPKGAKAGPRWHLSSQSGATTPGAGSWCSSMT